MSTFNRQPRATDGAQTLANAITVGVPLANLLLAAYLFVSALAASSDGGELGATTVWAVAASASSGVVLAIVMFVMAGRARRVEREESRLRAAAAKRVLRRPVPQSEPTSVTIVVRRPRAAV